MSACNGGSDGSINITGSNKVIANYSWSAGVGNPLLALSAGTYSLTATDVDGCQDSFSYTVNEPDALLSDIALLNGISCNGTADASAQVSASGGTPGFTTTHGATDTVGNTATASEGRAATAVTISDSERLYKQRKYHGDRTGSVVGGWQHKRHPVCGRCYRDYCSTRQWRHGRGGLVGIQHRRQAAGNKATCLVA